MRRAAILLAVVAAIFAAISVARRGRDGAPGDSSSRATDVAANGTVGRTAPSGSRIRDETDAKPVARRIEGDVVDATSSDPISGAEVLLARRRTPVPREGLLDTELASEPEIRTTTSSEGTFGVDVPVDSPADGPWFVTARAADRVDAVKVAAAGDDIRLELELSAESSAPHWGPIRVAATTQSSPDAPAIDVRLPARRQLTATLLAADGTTLPDGVLPLAELYEEADSSPLVREDAALETWSIDATKRYELDGWAEGFALVRRALTPEEIADGRVVVRLEPGVTVRGRIVAADPNAVGGTWIHLSSRDPSHPRPHVLSAAVDAESSFRFDHVAPGPWRLTVHTRFLAFLAERQVEIEGDADVELGEIVLPAFAWLHGVVRTPDGQPSGGSVVELHQPERDFRFVQPVVSKDDGSFSIFVPATGRRALLVRRRGFGAAVVRLDGADGADGATPLVVRLAPEGTLDIRIRMPREGDRLDWSVQTPDGAARWQPEEVGGNDTLGFDERHVCAGLAPGPLVVVIEDWSPTITPRRYTASVTVVAGETTEVEVGPER